MLAKIIFRCFIQDMRVAPIQYNYYRYNVPQKTNFTGKDKHSEQYNDAIRYAKRMKIKGFFFPQEFHNYNLDKVEGIQEGLKTFDGMNMKDIAFTFNNLLSIAVVRGCANQCLHCYVGAKPASDKSEEYISRMPWEDFVNLTSDLRVLKKRLGISPFTNGMNAYTDMFLDSDGMNLVLYDKNKKPHDYTEISGLMYNATGEKSVFDTAGWDPRNKAMQERAKKYVKYFSNSDNQDKVYQINLSLSPFNPMYVKAREYGYDPTTYEPQVEELNNIYNGSVPGEKLYRIYINRMANMLYEFSPLTDQNVFSVITRTAEADENNMYYFKEEDLKINAQNILKNLEMRYEADYNGKREIAKSRLRIKNYLSKYKSYLHRSKTKLIPAGRYYDLYTKRNPELKDRDLEKRSRLFRDSNALYHVIPEVFGKNIANKYFRVIDTNGKVYLFDNFKMLPTELQLNLSTKDKQTPKFNVDYKDEVVITKEMAEESI